MSERISSREFSRRAGCPETSVRNAIRAGRLARGVDGLLDADDLKTEWRSYNARSKRKQEAKAKAKANAAPKPAPEAPAHPMMLDDSFADAPHVAPPPESETVAEAVARIAQATAPHTRAEAERIKENYYALLRELEYKIKSRQVVELESVETEFYNAARSARDAWLNWPLTAGPIMAADLGIEGDRMTQALLELVHAHVARLGDARPGFARG